MPYGRCGALYRKTKGTLMLIVQRITTKWTKASRGGDGASVRNATPVALRLPPLDGAAPNYLLHDIRFLEWKNYECHSDVYASEAQTHVRIEPLFIHATYELVTTRFVWSWHHCGAPERDSYDMFQLTVGQWGRFTCNGRFGAESSSGREWRYHKTVFNVALTEQFDDNLFIQTTPTADDSRLAVLK
ncbi:hypothetical protein [Calycomorphotria hydatis]|uniref:Uncharacterized protein n=1 Tax=Calycomorphotria hydatis TaxID=2528027 RepID=A0A517T8R2_9PLAN|nr:hypothetical protein [Calycomorphotria hydatis]QDT64743.1 hypothetical protein V22_19840 [Calycomorphotria hydatis]